jgi:hypothetical protein
MTGRDNADGPSVDGAWDDGAESGEPDRSWSNFRDHGFSPDHRLTFANKRLHSFWQIKVGATAKAYHAQPFAGANGVAFSQGTQDPTCDQTGDLYNRQLPAIW